MLSSTIGQASRRTAAGNCARSVGRTTTRRADPRSPVVAGVTGLAGWGRVVPGTLSGWLLGGRPRQSYHVTPPGLANVSRQATWVAMLEWPVSRRRLAGP